MRWSTAILSTLLALDVGIYWLAGSRVPSGAAVGAILVCVGCWLDAASR